MIDLDGAHNEAFNEGFVDEIGVGLAMVQDLELRGRVSARTCKDVNRDAGRAGARLGAAVVLDAIVEGVASALGLKLGEEQRRRFARRWTDAEAFELYAQGRFGWAESEGGDLQILTVSRGIGASRRRGRCQDSFADRSRWSRRTCSLR